MSIGRSVRKYTEEEVPDTTSLPIIYTLKEAEELAKKAFYKALDGKEWWQVRNQLSPKQKQ